MDLSIIIPWRNDGGRRLEIFDWVMKRYHALFPGAQIILGIDDGEPFNRSKARNNAFRKVDRKYVLIGDADTVPFQENIMEGLTALVGTANWVIPYQTYFALTKESSDIILNSPYQDVLFAGLKHEFAFQSWAGQLLMRSDDFRKTGGYDERFENWGFEDEAFLMCLDAILGPHSRTRGNTYHLWHPRPAESVDVGKHDNPPNENLCNQYRELRNNRDGMLQYVDRRGSYI